MSVRLRFEGLTEFREALKALPEHLAQEAGEVVASTAQETAQAVTNHYPMGPTGNLKRNVRVKVSASGGNLRLGVRATLVSASPHAHLFERGTKVRQTRNGANRGAMPVGPQDELVIPRAVRARQAMTQKLIAIVRRAGLTVNA